MQIRIAGINDYKQILNLMRQLNPLDQEVADVELKVFEEIIESTYLNLIVAEDDGILLGSCYLNIIPNMTRGGRPYAVIENVITDEKYRNQGIGKAMMNEAINKAWRAGCYKIMLLTGRNNESTHRFYQRCGFSADQKQAYVMRADG